MSRYNLDTDFCRKCGCDGGLCDDCIKKKCYQQGKADAIEEFVDEVDKAITKMEHDYKIERTIHNACIVGMIIGTMKRIAKVLKEQNDGT